MDIKVKDKNVNIGLIYQIFLFTFWGRFVYTCLCTINSNPTFVLTTLAGIEGGLAISGITTVMPKLIQKFGIKASWASMLDGMYDRKEFSPVNDGLTKLVHTAVLEVVSKNKCLHVDLVSLVNEANFASDNCPAHLWQMVFLKWVPVDEVYGEM